MEFDRSTAKYIDSGRSISRDRIRFEAEIHANSIARELRKLTETALDNAWEVPRFEAEFTKTLKDGYIRLGILGKGGKENMNQSDYGKIGASLREQYKRMRGFSSAMANADLTKGQASYRAAMYGNNTIQIFSEMEIRAIDASIYQYARRSLTPGYKHCSQCKMYVTYPAWVPVSDVVPIGVKCDCRGNCKCGIEYSSKPPKKLIFKTAAK